MSLLATSASTTAKLMEERQRLSKLIQDYESGKITHLDESGQLRQTEPIESAKHRLAELDAKLGYDGA